MNPAASDITYITRVEELVWGSVLLALSLIIHGFGMVLTLHLTNNFDQHFRKSASFFSGIAGIVLGSWLILAIHVVEVLIWSAFFHWKECFVNFSTAIYFTGLQYTTVGSTLYLPRYWRLLEAMVATSGLLCFAWSTGVMMTLAQAFQIKQVKILGRRGLLRTGKQATPPP